MRLYGWRNNQGLEIQAIGSKTVCEANRVPCFMIHIYVEGPEVGAALDEMGKIIDTRLITVPSKKFNVVQSQSLLRVTGSRVLVTLTVVSLQWRRKVLWSYRIKVAKGQFLQLSRHDPQHLHQSSVRAIPSFQPKILEMMESNNVLWIQHNGRDRGTLPPQSLEHWI